MSDHCILILFVAALSDTLQVYMTTIVRGVFACGWLYGTSDTPIRNSRVKNMATDVREGMESSLSVKDVNTVLTVMEISCEIGDRISR
jgi:hypothetical protein